MPHLIWVTNIPTPYRNLRYRLFAEYFPPVGLTFEVAYMAETEPGRYWRFDRTQLDHPHRFFRGFRGRVRGVNLHLNPGLVAYVRRRRPDLLVIGGYSAPTAVALALLAPPNSTVVLGVESTLAERGTLSGPVGRLKRTVVARSAAYIGPGTKSMDYVRRINPVAADRPFIRLPNIVDRAVFVEGVERLRDQRDRIRARLGAAAGDQLWLVSARLETFKGLHQFLPLFQDVLGVRVVVAGAGAQRPVLEKLCADMRLPVRFVGQQDQRGMQQLYAAADLFALPSLRDPSPLSAVEALAAGLPLVLSDRCGNVDEAQSAGNGWRYHPDRREEMGQLVRHVASLPAAELATRAAESRRIYERDFDSARWVAAVASQLMCLLNAGRTVYGVK